MNEIAYRDYLIYPNDFVAHPDAYRVAWCYAHKDYDGAPIDADGPPGDNRCGACETVEACKEEIDVAIAEGDERLERRREAGHQ